MAFDPGLSSVRQHLSNEEFGVGSAKLAASDVNHYRKTFGSGGCEDRGDLASVARILHVDSGSSEVQLQADELLTSFPMPDLIDGEILQGVDGQKSHQTCWKFGNLRCRKLVFTSCECCDVRDLRTKRGRTPKIGAG